MFEDYAKMNEKTRQYFERAREDASREAYLEIKQNDFKYKAQYSSGFLVLPDTEFIKNTIIETQTVGIDLKTSKSLVNCRHSRYDIYKSLEMDAKAKKSVNTDAMYLFLNLDEGCDIMIGTSDGTVKYLATLVGPPFYSTDFYLNGLNHRRYIANILEAPSGIKITKNISSKFNERFQQWYFD